MKKNPYCGHGCTLQIMSATNACHYHFFGRLPVPKSRQPVRHAISGEERPPAAATGPAPGPGSRRIETGLGKACARARGRPIRRHARTCLLASHRMLCRALQAVGLTRTPYMSSFAEPSYCCLCAECKVSLSQGGRCHLLQASRFLSTHLLCASVQCVSLRRRPCCRLSRPLRPYERIRQRLVHIPARLWKRLFQ